MCGIWGYLGLGAGPKVHEMAPWLMHRGQEGVAYACVTSDGVVRVEDPLKIKSRLCIGHTRYSTSGPYGFEPQPIVLDDTALVFNGTITNYRALMRELRDLGYGELQDYDGFVLAVYLRHMLRTHGIQEGLRRAMGRIEGSYSLLIILNDSLIVARDPWGFRPLALGVDAHGYAVASETSVLEAMGMKWRELEPGVALMLGGDELVRMPRVARAHCALEYIYFLRPDSIFNGVRVYEARKRLGVALARKEDKDVDIVSPVPETARVAAEAYAWSLGKPIEEVIVKNRYLGRGFIKPPGQRGIELFNVIGDYVKGKSVALVDDSIIRGDTMRRITVRIRRSGAREIHVRVSSPPVRYPCFMGMDFPSRGELVAHGRSVDDVRRIIGSDSLIYLTVDELEDAVGTSELCTACFTGKYPFPLNIEEMESVFARG